MKTTKLISEVQEVINSNLSYVEKVAQLMKVETHNRPGAKEAERIVSEYTEKYRNYKPLQRSAFFARHYTKFNSQEKYERWYVKFDRLRKYSKAPISYNLVDYLASNNQGQSVQGLIDQLKDAVYYRDLSTQLKKIIRNYCIELKKQEAEAAEKQQKVEKFCAETGLGIYFFDKAPASVQQFQSDRVRNYCKVRGYIFTAHEMTTEDWDYYSKAWHRAHGPKITVNERYVKIFKDGKAENITVERWAGNWFLNVLIKFFDLKPVKVAKSLRAVQINPYYDVNKIEDNLYEVSFLGEFQAYCAVEGDMTYHAQTIEDAKNGLVDKARKAEEKQKIEAGQLFSAEFLNEKYHFCYPAMREFANFAGLDINETYSLSQLKDAVKAVKKTNRDFIAHYIREFRTINAL